MFKNNKTYKRKLMEVTHVLVGIMPSGSIIYGISGHGCNWVGFSRFLQLSFFFYITTSGGFPELCEFAILQSILRMEGADASVSRSRYRRRLYRTGLNSEKNKICKNSVKTLIIHPPLTPTSRCWELHNM